MDRRYIMLMWALLGIAFDGPSSYADALQTHRIPATLAAEAVSEAVSTCARQGYQETAVVIGRGRCNHRCLAR
jgi:hypothetical protein